MTTYCTDCRFMVGGTPNHPMKFCHVSRRYDGTAVRCMEARNDVMFCGPHASRFESKPPRPPSVWQRLRTAFTSSAGAP
jgi:hypothetical protein